MAMNPSSVKILITQPYSRNLACAYDKIVAKYGAQVEFQRFIETSPVPVPVFRRHKKDLHDYSVFLFTTKTSIDYLFQLSEACGIKIPLTKKYFCVSENLANYLRKYIEFRKRKVFHGEKAIEDLFPLIKKHKKESFLMAGSGEKKESLRAFFKENKYKYKEIIIYETKTPSLKECKPQDYDVIVFFSPITVNSFAQNFPNYQQGNTEIASFNEMTAKAVEKMGWETTICPRHLQTPSIVDAIDIYLRQKMEEYEQAKSKSKK